MTVEELISCFNFDEKTDFHIYDRSGQISFGMVSKTYSIKTIIPQVLKMEVEPHSCECGYHSLYVHVKDSITVDILSRAYALAHDKHYNYILREMTENEDSYCILFGSDRVLYPWYDHKMLLKVDKETLEVSIVYDEQNVLGEPKDF